MTTSCKEGIRLMPETPLYSSLWLHCSVVLTVTHVESLGCFETYGSPVRQSFIPGKRRVERELGKRH